ncbi:uncharacterized protein LOC124165444 [Ischnura elegans]|uniref:uncharacterized protein LOC124165444 n=1 Tax=Ischnura elegans TaxID=197161 RepID=UPI001ED8A837|nr:uncharacterized protein LOC124165444 [Ischnura elegans]XP_046398829.1 uncharacterized protein LOC124165444 [Ischnura elegans]
MILLFHNLCIVGRIVYHVICDKLFGEKFYMNDIYVQLEPRDYKHKSYVLSKRCVQELKNIPLPKTGDIVCRFDGEAGLKFFPPVYVQRYNAVKEILSSETWRGKLKKVLDAGCSELSFFPFLKNTPGIEEILALDIDVELLHSFVHRAAPLLADHLSSRSTPFRVKVLAGSISQPDPCLKGCDAVIAIELIEHLYPGELEEVPFSVFGFIRPLIALFTTPNVDFNVLFGHMRGFRHPDHKFEWSRVQFQDWAMNIVERFPDYEVAFKGIGEGPIGSEHFGCCSQMAIFTKRNIQENESGSEEALTSINDSGLNQDDSLFCQENYKVIEDFEYPVYVDSRSERQKMEDSACYFISNAAAKMKSDRQVKNEELFEEYLKTNHYPDEEDVDDIYITLEKISNALDQFKATEDQWREILEKAGWKVENFLGKLCVNYTAYENRCSSGSEEEELEDVGETEVKDSSLSEKAESDWDSNENDGKDWCPAAQNPSPEPSCESDWNEDDTQARAYVDSGYPNSFSAQDRDLANSVDLHGSSLEEDSEDDIGEDLANAFPPVERLQPVQNDNMNNMNHINAAPVHGVFYEVEGNQDENQDVVNNNCDNEGNNAEAIFGLDDVVEPGLNIEDGSESEGDAVDPVSEDESDVEHEEAGLEDEAELVERLLQQAQLPRRQSREANAVPGNRPINQRPPAVMGVHNLGGGDAWHIAPAPLPVDLDQDEGFAEVMAGPAIAVEPVDEGGGGEPSPF